MSNDDGAVTTAGRMLDLLRAHGTLSRVELAKLSGFTPATITNVVRRLSADGLIEEAGLEQQRRGQPRRLLELKAHAWYAVGVQMDEITTTIVIIDFTGNHVASTRVSGVGSRRPEAAIPALADQIEGLLHTAGIPREKVLGVGLATHGPQDREQGMVLLAYPSRHWIRYQLTSELSKHLELPVLLENDATAAAIGEQWAGQLPTNTFGLIYMGAGLGGGVIIDGNVYRGRTSNAVEIGHISLLEGSTPCVCGNRGCTEAEASPRTVVAQALDKPELAQRLALQGHNDDTLTEFQRIAVAWRAGDPDATGVIEKSARWVGRAAVTMANLFDLDTVVLAGPAFAIAGPVYKAFVEDELTRHALGRVLSEPQVILSQNTKTAASTGAALHVLRSTFADAKAEDGLIPATSK